MAAISNLIPLYAAFGYWSMQAYTAGQRLDPQEFGDEERGSADLDLANEALASKKFWGFSLHYS